MTKYTFNYNTPDTQTSRQITIEATNGASALAFAKVEAEKLHDMVGGFKLINKQ